MHEHLDLLDQEDHALETHLEVCTYGEDEKGSAAERIMSAATDLFNFY